MDIKTYKLGPLKANNYLLSDSSGEAVLIDCSGVSDELLADLKNVDLKYVLLTHGHFDHILGINQIKTITKAKVLLAEQDKARIEESLYIVDAFGITDFVIPEIDGFLMDNQVIEFGNSEIKIISTPGHTEGSVCYSIDEKLFSGDTLFKDCVGRCDLPGGNFENMKKSIKKLFELPENTEVFPGHNDKTSVKYEKCNNEIRGEL